MLSFAGSDAFTIAGAPIAKDAGAFDAGLNLTPAETFGIGYQGQFGDGANCNGFNAKLSFKF